MRYAKSILNKPIYATNPFTAEGMRIGNPPPNSIWQMGTNP